MKKRIISLILVLALCLSLLPTVFAADTTTKKDGRDGIVIDENTADKTIWSDGNGGTATWDRGHYFLTLDNYNVETDGTPALTTSISMFFDLKGTNSFTSKNSAKGAIDISEASGSFSLNVGGYKGNSLSGTGTLTVDGGDNPAIYGFDRYNTFCVNNSVAVTLKSTGNVFYDTETETPKYYFWSGKVELNNNAKLTLEGASAGHIDKLYVNDNAQMLVHGEVNRITQELDATVTGSTLANADESAITADVDLTKNPYQVGDAVAKSLLFTKKIVYVASVTTKDGATTTKYETLPDAFAAAKTLPGCTVKVIAEASQLQLVDGVYVDTTGDEYVTLDLNGHSVDHYVLNVGGYNHTGKLKVIDTKGGNGAIGLAVRGGGDLVFDPGNQATNCLQLEFYGGSAKFYSGRVSAWTFSNGYTPKNLLPEGYAYYRYISGGTTKNFINLSNVSVPMSYSLSVAKCTHGSYAGDTCEYCGTDFSGSAAKLTTASGTVTYHSSYADARSAAQRSANSTLTLLTDAALENSESNHASGTYTIDLNGKNLTSSDTPLAFEEKSTANITLVNSASGKATVSSSGLYAAELYSGTPKLTIGEENGTNNLELVASGHKIALLLNAGTLEVFGGSIINTSFANPRYTECCALLVEGRNAVAILHGGTFTGPREGVKITQGTLKVSGGEFNASDYGLYLDDSAGTVTCTLTGGTFHKLYSSKPLTSLLASGYTFAADARGNQIIDLSTVTPNNGAYILNDTVYVVPHTHNFKPTGKCACGASCPHKNVGNDGKCADCNQQVMVARVLASDGTTVIGNYETLSAAVSAAQDKSGSTVQLLADVTLPDAILLSGTVTLDLNGKTLSTNGRLFTAATGASLTLINTSDTRATVSAAHVICLNRFAAVNIGNADGSASDIQFNLGTELFTTETDLTGCAVNIYGGAFTSDSNYAIDASNASAENNPFQLLIQGGTFTGKKAGVRIVGDNIKPTITGGSFYSKPTDPSNIGTINAAGLIVDSNVTNFISGGIYQGIYSYTTNLSDLLKSGYDFKEDSIWIGSSLALSRRTSRTVTVAEAPINSLTVKLNDEIVTGGTYTAYVNQPFTFSAVTDPADGVIVTWYYVKDTTDKLTGSTYTPTAEGSFTLLCVATTTDGYALSRSISVTVEKKKSETLSVSQTGWEYGNTAVDPTYTPIEGYTAVVTYAALGSEDFTKTVPTNAGQYTVKVTIETPTTIYTGTAGFEITPKSVTVSGVTILNKTYDGTTDAEVNNPGTLNGKLTTDSLSYTVKAEFEDKNAGETKPVTLSITLTGASKDNYVLSNETQKTAKAMILQKDVVVTGVTATSRAYEAGNTTVKLSGGTVSHVCTGDDLTVVLTNAKGEMKTDAVGEDKPVTVTGAALGGKDKDNYFLSAQPQNVTVTITRATLTSAVNMSGYTYGDTPTTPTVTANPENGTVTYYYSTENRNQGGTPWTGSTKLNAGTYYLYAVIGETTNYASTTTAPVAFTVSPRPVTVSGIAAEDKTYNGNTDATLVYTGVSFGGLVEGDTLSVTASGVFADKNAGANKTVNLTGLTLGGASVDNYVLAENGQQSTATATIHKKVISITDATVAEKVYDGETDAQVTGVSFADLISGESLTPNTDYRIKAANFNDANVDKADRVTFTAELAENANYIFANDSRTEEHTKTGVSIQKADGSAAAPTAKAGLTYSGDAQTLIDAGSSTTGEMQYKLEDGSYSTDLPAATNAGTYNVWYKVVGDVNHKDTTEQSVEATIAQAEVIVTALDKKAYVGDKAPDLNAPKLGNDYTVKGLIGEDALGGTIALSYSETPDMTKTGTFRIVASGADGGQNYMVKYVPGTLTIEVRPAGVKGYPIETGKTENGTVTVTPKDAGAGNTVTITTDPDDGYELGDLTVTDENGKKLPLTNEGDGKYSFTMPSGKVRIEARFVRETSPFRDVFQNDYYYEAVKWASAADITGGVGNGLFDPHGSCTRAQIVTFLWRAEGSPEPARMSRFADVSADAYYAKAVAWAVENGITTGTGADSFSPDASCTRAQAVTFLWRAAGSPESEQMSAFTDVPADAYYAKAVAWAVENGITTGTGAGTFSPDATCTRAQIVTFLWRAEKKAKQ